MAENNIIQDEALDWNSKISDDGKEFVLLPDGEYPFTIVALDREHFDGSEKQVACWKAVLSIRVDGGEHGETTVKENIFLTRKSEWKIGQLFVSIGYKQKGEKDFAPDWNKVVQSTGTLKLGHRSFKGKDGDDVTINTVKAFLEPKYDGIGSVAATTSPQVSFNPNGGF